MISYVVYKIVHYVGIFALVASLAAALGRSGPLAADDPWRRRSAIVHGTALFVVLLGGFGMLARLEITHGLTLPGWIWAKLVIWTLLAALLVIARRAPSWSAAALVGVPLLATLAGWFAFTKPL